MEIEWSKWLRAIILHLEFLQETGVRYLPLSAEGVQLVEQLQYPYLSVSSNQMQRMSFSSSSEERPPTPSSQQLWGSEVLARTPGEKQAALEALRQRVLECRKCEHLARSRTHVVFGAGNPAADLMFVGEAPGVEEDRQGEPFVGAAGKLLTKVIETMGLSRDQVYIANVLKCRPDTPPGKPGNRKPTADEIIRCVPYLVEQIRIIQPKVIVALGATAVEGLLGRQAAAPGILRLRGKWLEFQGIPLMPTYHPAFLLYNPTIQRKRELWEDMLKVMERLGLPISEKQRNYFRKAAGQ